MLQRSEQLIVFLVGAVQFVNILDFVMVMPLGPDFAGPLGIPTSHLGYVSGSYTAAASVAGLAGAFFLDRFDRRSALAVAMLGLAMATALGGAATGLPSLLAARMLAGLFGGPATSLSFAIIADVVPVERRGRAMGAVMGAFAAANVLGLVVGLELARVGGWRLPFFGVGAVGLAITAATWALLPPLVGHLDRSAGPQATFSSLLKKSDTQLSFLMTAIVMLSGFLVIPNISTFAQRNLGFPRARLSEIYAMGGAVSFLTTRYGGRLVDRVGSLAVATVGVVLAIGVSWLFFLEPGGLDLHLFMVGFMLALGLRNVAYNTLASKVPAPAERARFQSLQSAVGHAAAAMGAFISSEMLDSDEAQRLVGIERVAIASMGMSLLVPLCVAVVEGRVRRRTVVAPAALGSGAESR
jgi:predicted MFS family arabinose efflux permease